MKAGVFLLIAVALIQGCSTAPVIIERQVTDTLYLPSAQDTLPIAQDSARPWLYTGSAEDSSYSFAVDLQAGQAVINKRPDTVVISKKDTLWLTDEEKQQVIKNEFHMDKDFMWMLMGIGMAVYAAIRYGIAKLTGKV